MDDFDCDPTPDVWYGRFSWSRLCLKLAIAYVVLAFFCWEEMRYRLAAVDVAAEVKVVGRDNQGRSLVRYTFRDPQTGAHRENTVAIAAAAGSRQALRRLCSTFRANCLRVVSLLKRDHTSWRCSRRPMPYSCWAPSD